MKNSPERAIQTTLEHIKDFVEKPHPVFGGLPVCPFAQQARISGKIDYQVYSFSVSHLQQSDCQLWQLIHEFNEADTDEILLVIHPNPQALTIEEIEYFIREINQKISALGLVAFGGHPRDRFNIEGVYTRQAPYIHFTVQRKKQVQKASDVLLKTDYYENWTKENLDSVGLPREDI